jgi:methionyl-tRNA synthetase
MNNVDLRPETSPKRTFAITTPLYYVNGSPHIGHAYTTMAADALARFQRLRGREVLLITGTDEHGQKIERTAIAANLSPQAHCDQVVADFQRLWQTYNIQLDRFIRTTDPHHEQIVTEFFQRVLDRGDIYQGQQQGWYCVACEEFKEERDLLADHHCPLHPSKAAEWRDETNYFFKLSAYQERLEQLYADQPDFIQPNSRRNEVMNFVKSGLQDFSISRVNLAWGIPLPNDPSHTIYVWFDALLGYISALAEPGTNPNLEESIAKWWPANVHIIGKDILRFHAVYWPAMLMSAGLPLPEMVFGHGFFTKDGRKISKSEGNIVDPQELVEIYGAEALRYFFLRCFEFGQDGDFNESRFVETVNADLANGLGNLLNRTLGMVKKYSESPDLKVPTCDLGAIPADHPLKLIGLTLADRVTGHYDKLAFSEAAEAVLELVRASNKYIDDAAPWTMYKTGQISELQQVLYSLLESARLAGLLLSPAIPKIATEIYHQLGLRIDFDALQSSAARDSITVSDPTTVFDFAEHSSWGFLPCGLSLNLAQPVFARLELSSRDSS